MSPRALTFLHLSDLQFGKHHLFAPEEAEGDAAHDTLFGRLSVDLDVLRGEHGLKPDVVLLTGDLAEWGKAKEFEQVQAFAEKLQGLLGLERRRMLVIPGNHDVNRDACQAYFSNYKAEADDGGDPPPPYWDKWRFFHRFFAKFYEGIDQYGFSEDQPWTLFELPELRLVVAGLNSTMKESHRDGDHYGWVGEEQLRWFENRLRSKSGWFRLATVHHNVVRKAVGDDENLRDADDMKRILGSRLNLVLHGHRHQAGIEWWGPKLPILAAGSAAVSADWRADELPNQYQVIRVEREVLRWWTRMYALDQKKFVADCRGSVDGNTWEQAEEIRFDAVDEALQASEAPVSAGMSQSGDYLESGRGLGYGLRLAGRDTLLDSVVALVRPREGDGADAVSVEIDGLACPCLRVTVREPSSVARQFPIAVVDGALTEEIVEAFVYRIVERDRVGNPFVKPLIIHRGDASAAALDRARKAMVKVQTLAQYQGLPDLRPAVERMVQRLERDERYPSERYVRQRMALSLARDAKEVDDAHAQLDTWLRTADGALVLVLGSFGTGKSFLMHELALRLGRAHLDGSLPLVPLLIELRQLERTHDLDELLGQVLLRSGIRTLVLPVLRHLIEQGSLVLLLDGFDELALRVRYAKAAEHLGAVLRLATGDAKVVITSRTEHFLTDQQVTTELHEQARRVPSLESVRLLPFDPDQIQEFLRKKLGDEADERYRMMLKVNDLVGLSENPRLLNFIADLDRADLERAETLGQQGAISAAAVYEILLTRWLVNEEKRAHPQGMATGLTVDQCWRAVTALAVALWTGTTPDVSVDALTQEVVETLGIMGGFDREVIAHAVASGTLLVRDESGRFRFVHQSVMEWLVAREIARQLEQGEPRHLHLHELSPLMVEFIADLASRERLVAWAQAVHSIEEASDQHLRVNALALLHHLGVEVIAPLRMAGKDLRGTNLGPSLRNADLRGADLRGQRLANVDATDADLRDVQLGGAILDGTTLRGADLRNADLSGARLRGADLTGARLKGASLRRAVLIGATLDDHALGDADTFGAALPGAERNLALDVSIRDSGMAVAFSPDGTLLALAGMGGRVVIREANNSGRELASLAGHAGSVRSVAWSGDEARLASAGDDGTVRVWDVQGGEQVASLAGHAGAVRSVGWSGDGARLASAGDDGTVRVWDVQGGEQVASLVGHAGAVRSVAWSGDGARLASAGEDGTVRVWDVQGGEQVASLAGHAGRVRSVAWSGDGERLTSAGDDGTVRVWDVQGGEQVASLAGHAGRVRSVAWSGDGARLTSAGDDGSVRVWDVQRWSLVQHVVGQSGLLMSITLDRTGRWAVVGGFASTIDLLDLDHGQLVASFFGTRHGWVVITPDGRYKTHGDVSDSLWQRIGLCRFELDELVPWLPELAHKRLPADWSPFRASP